MAAASRRRRPGSAVSTEQGGPRSVEKSGSRQAPRGRRRSGPERGLRKRPGRPRHPVPKDRGHRPHTLGARSEVPRKVCPDRNAGSGNRGRHAAWRPRESRSSHDAGAAAALAPPIDAHEEEQPDDVDKMPIPGRRLEAKVVIRFEMASPGPVEAHDQKRGSDNDVETVKPGRHEKGRRIDAAGEVKRGVAVLVSLYRGEADTEKNGQREAPQQPAAVA